jgi:hypothetical protein
MSALEILAYLEGAAATTAAVATPITPVGAGAALADIFLKIALAGARAHSGITGKPIDITLFHAVQPVDIPPA